MLSERSERSEARPGSLGAIEERARVAATLGVAADRIALAPHAGAIHLALFFVLADAGDEVLVASDADPLAIEAAAISGLAAQALDAMDGASLFEAASERTRAVVLGAIDPETLALLAELDLPLVTRDASIARASIFASDAAPLAIVHSDRWLAVLGPAAHAEPSLARLEAHAHVFFGAP